MKTALMFAKARNGKGGTFRVLKVGETIEDGDVEVIPNGVCTVSYGSPGQIATKVDTIIRLEFDK